MKYYINLLLTLVFFIYGNINYCLAANDCYMELSASDIDAIYIRSSSGGNGRPREYTENYMKNNFEFQSVEQHEIDYIVHYLNSISMVDDGESLGGSDMPIVNIHITQKDGSIANMGFIMGRFYDADDKQFAVSEEEYTRFLNYIYALKTHDIVIADYPSYKISNWALESVEQAKTEKILFQYNQIDYQRDITRLEVCQIIDNLLTDRENNVDIVNGHSFKDVNDVAVSRLFDIGIVKGESDTHFCPYNYISREEFAVVLNRLFHYKGSDKEIKSINMEFIDEHKISNWAYDSVQNMSLLGVVRGYNDGCFNPKGYITKEEAIVMLLRLYNIL